MELTRKAYYATKQVVDRKRGAIHEAQNCTAFAGVGWPRVQLTKKAAEELLAAGSRNGRKHVYLCARCKSMK